MISEPSIRKPVVLHIITGLNDGGAEAVLFNLVRSTASFEHKVISLMGPGKYGPKMEAEGIEVSYLGLSSSLPSLLKLLRLTSKVRSAAPDVVQCWMYHADLLGGYASWRAGVRAIVWGLHHTTLDREGTKWATRKLVRVNAWASSWLPNRIISCSRNGNEVHREIGYPADKMVVVHNGYNTAAFQPDNEARAAIRAEFNISDDQILLGCVARFNPQKDHQNLILGFAEVTKTYPNARLLLIGPGLTVENNEITALIAQTGLKDLVTLVGPRADIPAIMNGLDLHVLGSAFGEAFPNVLSEAMSCGTPCVATDVGDSATIVGDTGRIVPPRDSMALANAILDMAYRLSDPVVQAACRDRILGNFTLEHMTGGYTRVWSDSIAEAMLR
jgi:glycosyltransferase involved in cell wall biosynthesis